MKKIIITTLTCALLLSTQALGASAKEFKNSDTPIQITASYITNHYTAKVGLTQVLSGTSYRIQSGGNCADIKVTGNLIRVTGKSSGTIVVNAYDSNGVLRTVNYITFKY